MKSTFFLKVNTQFDNLGDALINRELIRLCAKNGNVCVCTKGVPDHFLSWLGLQEISPVKEVKGGLSFWILLLAGCLMAMVPGRQVYYVLNPGGYVGDIRFRSFVARLVKAGLMFTLRIFGVKGVLVGASYESLGVWNRKSIKVLSKVLSVHAVRDEMTRDYCASNGIRVTGVLPDLAFNLPNIYSRVNKVKDLSNQYVGVFSFRDAGEEFEGRVTRLLVDAVTSGKFQRVKLVYQVGRDAKIMNTYFTRANDAGLGEAVDIAPLMSSIEENLLEYANVDYVFSNRLHVLLLALRAGVTPIALVRRGSNAKIRGLFSDMGLASHCFDVDEFLDINQILIKVGGKKESVRLAAERYDATRGRLNNGFERMVRG